MAKKKTKKKSSGDATGDSNKSKTLASLGKLNARWKKAEPAASFAPLPDGLYQSRIDGAVIQTAKKSGRLQIAWVFTVAAGKFANRKLWKYDGLDTEENLSWLKASLESLELETPEDISELPELLTELQGQYVEITVKTKDEYQNIYFNSLIEESDLEEGTEEDADEKE